MLLLNDIYKKKQKMLEKNIPYTMSEIRKLGLRPVNREPFGAGGHFVGEEHGYITDRVIEGGEERFILFFKYLRV